VHSSWRRYVTDAVLQDCLGGLRERFVGSSPRELTRVLPVLRAVNVPRFDPGDYLVLDDYAPAFGSLMDCLVVCNPARGVSDPEVAAEILAWPTSQHEHPRASRPPFSKAASRRRLLLLCMATPRVAPCVRACVPGEGCDGCSLRATFGRGLAPSNQCGAARVPRQAGERL